MEAESNLRYDPFVLLYNYVRDHQCRATSVSGALNDDAIAPSTRQENMPSVAGNARLDDALRVMDFLVGDTLTKSGATGCPLPSIASNLIDGALQILDESFSNRCGTFPNLDDKCSANVRENNAGNDRLRRKNTAHGISRLESPNGRIAYLVSEKTCNAKKKSSSLLKIEDPSGMEKPKEKFSSCYLCMLPDEMAILSEFSPFFPAERSYSTNIQSADAGDRRSNHPLQLYCSCRSFFELSRRATNDFRIRNHRVSDCKDNSIVMCKHLLAIRLLPYFSHSEENILQQSTSPFDQNFHISTMKFVSEEDFSRAILQRIIH